MKKRISVLLAAVLAIGCLATACGDNAGGEVRVGLGLNTDMSSSKDATADADGLSQADLTVVAVTLNADDTIADLKVDVIQVKTYFDATGTLKADNATSFQTKRELGDKYGMKGTSASMGVIADGGEWYEQADAFEAWAKGKKLADVEAALGSDGYASDETLKAGCTIHVNGMIVATVKAIKEAQTGTYKASASDKLSIGIVATPDGPQSATADAAGAVTAYGNFTAVTSDASGKITCCILDSVQAKFAWDTTGKITSDLTVDTTTKYDLKEDYGMKTNSANKGVIANGGEWYEQADAFMAHVKGMTASQVTAIAVDENGYTTDETLKAGCTMNVSSYIAAVEKALK